MVWGSLHGLGLTWETHGCAQRRLRTFGEGGVEGVAHSWPQRLSLKVVASGPPKVFSERRLTW